MFTGLIQATGKISLIGEDRLQVACSDSRGELILKDLAVGDSVAVDGVCLTGVEILSQGYVAIASPETFHRSTLGHKTDGTVNLETSLRAGSKLGGHFVTGHVDGLGCLQESKSTASAWEMTFISPAGAASQWDRQIAPYIVPKGSIAVNGISLTVAECDVDGKWFKVAVIPHSYEETNLRYLKPETLVNIETDILGKYVAKFMRLGGNGYQEEITPEFLAEHGFM
jgi:riboflavin synthase